MSIAYGIAETILAGFNKHYRLFRAVSAAAKQRFERADWPATQEANKARIQMYDQRVDEAVQAVLAQFPAAVKDESLWPQVKLAYIAVLYNHRQPELAESFYNSVACSVLHRRYYHNEFIFWRPAVSTSYLEGGAPSYRVYNPQPERFRRTVLEIVRDFKLANPFENLRRDLRYLMRAIEERFPRPWQTQLDFHLQVLPSLFFRNKAAYLVGRVVNANREHPFAVPILQTPKRELFLDTILFDYDDLLVLFSFARAYFMVDMELPSAFVAFLASMLPGKPRAEIYTVLGLQKHGKTLFYRDLQQHLFHSTDKFVIAPGIKGMVMLVFTLPSFPYVFKIIMDYFAPPKDIDRKTVKEKYLLVKYHDRVGRMADTLEYSTVAFPLARFDQTLIDELMREAASNIEFEDYQIIIKHMYIERRMIPLNIYLQDADEPKMTHAVKDYGNAIKELAGANIFPGDLLLKNFGVTRHRRVVFYDYDEISHMTQCNFRNFPRPSSLEDEMSAEPSFHIDANDIFPEQFATMLFHNERAREVFLRYHRDLTAPEFWQDKRQRIEAGEQEDLFPYPETIRFCNRFAPRAEAKITPLRAATRP